jgi:signal transduction histidine kinase
MERGSYVRLSVSDNGEGMTPEAQKRAFEPFFTTSSTRYRPWAGNGVRLCQTIHITLYSELGLGTSFGLYFPAQQSNGAK